MEDVLRDLRATLERMPEELRRSLGRRPGGTEADGDDEAGDAPPPAPAFPGAASDPAAAGQFRTFAALWGQFVPDFRRFATAALRGRTPFGPAAHTTGEIAARAAGLGTSTSALPTQPDAAAAGWQAVGRAVARGFAAARAAAAPGPPAIGPASGPLSRSLGGAWRAANAGLGVVGSLAARLGRTGRGGASAAMRGARRIRGWAAARSAGRKARRSAVAAAARHGRGRWRPGGWKRGKDWNALLAAATARLHGHGGGALGRWNFRMPSLGGVGAAVGRSRLARRARVMFRRGGRKFRAGASGLWRGAAGLGRKFRAGVGAFARRPGVAAVGRGLGRAAMAAGTAGRVAVGAAAGFASGMIATMIDEVVRDGLKVAMGMRLVAENVNASNRQFARYNPQISAGHAMLEFGNFRRNVAEGRDVQELATALAGSVNRMRDAWQGFDQFKNRASSMFGQFGAGMTEGVGRALSPFFEGINSWLKENDPKGEMMNRAGRMWGGAIGGFVTGGPLGAIQGFLKEKNAPPPVDKPVENPWGQAMHQIVRQGPLRAPRKVPPP